MGQRFDNLSNGVEQEIHLTKNIKVYERQCMIEIKYYLLGQHEKELPSGTAQLGS